MTLCDPTATHDISRVLRVPGTFNFKNPENPRSVEIVIMRGVSYDLDDFNEVMSILKDEPIKLKTTPKKKLIPPVDISPPVPTPIVNVPEIENIPISDKIKSLILILHGDDGFYLKS